jgi:hypothetical protein
VVAVIICDDVFHKRRRSVYLPSEVTEEGAEREVKCGYWRIWSNARHSPEYHHAAMRRIAAYYKGMQVPGLSRVKVWSDGDPTTHKGRKQFGRMVRWPRSAADGGEGIELHHNCLPAHHGAGQWIALLFMRKPTPSIRTTSAMRGA